MSFRFLSIFLLFLQFPLVYFLFTGEYLQHELCADIQDVETAPRLTDEAVLAYLRKRGMERSALELTEKLKEKLPKQNQNDKATKPKQNIQDQKHTTLQQHLQDKKPSKPTKGIQGAPIVYFDGQKAESNKNCRLNHDSFSWIGAGHDGIVYLAGFDCDDDDQTQQQFVLKLAIQKNKTHSLIEVPGVTKSKTEKLQRLYDEIVGSDSTPRQRDSILNRFAIVLGTVELPFDLVSGKLKAMAGEKLSKYYGIDIAKPSNPRDTVLASVMPKLVGRPLGLIHAADDQHQFSVPERRTIVQDVVFIFRHMFDRNILHCDVWPRHFIFHNQTKKVSMFDFDRVMYITNKTKQVEDKRRRQLLQALTFVSLACNDVPKDSRQRIKYELDVCYNPAKRTTEQVLSVLNPVLKKCNDLFPNLDELQFGTKELNNATKAFDKLNHWVHGQRISTKP